jgi:hypothetical protein
MKKFQVRTKEWEKRNWKVIAEFDTFKEAQRFAIRSEYAQRKTDKMFDAWDIKNIETKERFIIAE